MVMNTAAIRLACVGAADGIGGGRGLAGVRPANAGGGRGGIGPAAAGVASGAITVPTCAHDFGDAVGRAELGHRSTGPRLLRAWWPQWPRAAPG